MNSRTITIEAIEYECETCGFKSKSSQEVVEHEYVHKQSTCEHINLLHFLDIIPDNYDGMDEIQLSTTCQNCKLNIKLSFDRNSQSFLSKLFILLDGSEEMKKKTIPVKEKAELYKKMEEEFEKKHGRKMTQLERELWEHSR